MKVGQVARSGEMINKYKKSRSLIIIIISRVKEPLYGIWICDRASLR